MSSHDFHVLVVVFHWNNCIRHVVVLTALGSMTFKQGLYDESLRMRWRLRDILMTTSPMSEDMATGRQ